MIRQCLSTLPRWRPLALGTLLPAVLLTGFLGGCVSYDLADNARPHEEVVAAAVAVLKERFYQVRVYRKSGHVVAFSPVVQEGPYKVRNKVDVHVHYETTGHYMPKVFVRKYVDSTEPPLENWGDFSSPWEISGHPFPRQNWQVLHYQNHWAIEIRKAIVARLNLPVPQPPKSPTT